MTLLSRPKLMILGHARHGKDTAGEWLRANHGYEFVSSSWFMANRVILPAMKAAWRNYTVHSVGCDDPNHCPPLPMPEFPNYDTVEECYNDRGNHRTFWYDQIAAYNAHDPSRLTRAIFDAGNHIYVGLRNKRELLHGQLSKAIDLTIWIDASDRCLSEPTSSCTVEPWMADVIVDNNGGLADLDRNMAILYNKWIRLLEWHRQESKA